MKLFPRKHETEDEPPRLTLRDALFATLIETDEELRDLRRKFKKVSARERREAALWTYDESLARGLFAKAISRLVDDSGFYEYACADEDSYSGAVCALAIDPRCAVAMLTVGSVEYQLGRIDEAMKLFLDLTDLPGDTEDLSEIIDQAGDFLTDEHDYGNALRLYATAAEHYPREALYWDALCYCMGKLGRTDEALEYARRAVALEPDNYFYLNNLGWSLVELRRYEEAEEVLGKALNLSPDDDHLAQNNLDELRRRRKLSARGKKQR